MYALTEPELLDEFASVYALIFFMQTLDHFAGMSLDWPMDVRALFSALSLANFNLQLLAMDCYEGWGGLPRRLALQFTCPLLCLAIYGFLLLIYATLLFLGRVTTRAATSRSSQPWYAYRGRPSWRTRWTARWAPTRPCSTSCTPCC